MSASTTGSEFKTRVLQAVDIVELIGQSVALKRRGKDYLGLCPFHQEKTASFHVSPAKQFFHCYGCKAGGNAIDFVMRRDRIEFIEALRLLGRQAGIEMPRSGADRQQAGQRQALLEANSAACAFFEKMILDPQAGEAARQYLQQRRIDEQSVRRFQIGLAADGWDHLLRGPVGRKFGPAVLEAAGLLKRRENGSGFYDTFRNRLIFPIRDEGGRVIAFGGRVMPGSSDPAKYLNSPETPLFSKGRCVFGLDLARQKMVETRTAVVVEGYTDVVMAHQFGVSNVVSVLGTAMTEQHVGILRRFADRIVLLFDADTAGDTAADRSVELFLRQPVEIAIAAMPAGVDPDEFLLEKGAGEFEALLSGAIDALSYKWKQLVRHFVTRAGDLTGQQKAIEEYLKLLAEARGAGPLDPLRWGAALTRVSRLTEIPVDDLNRRFRPGRAASRRSTVQAGRRDEPTETAPGRPSVLTAQDRAERWILGVLLAEPNRWEHVQHQVHVEDFTGADRRRLAECYWRHQRDEGEPAFNEFLALLQEPALSGLAVELIEEAAALQDLDQALGEAAEHMARTRRRLEEQKLVADIRRGTDKGTAEQQELLLLQEMMRQPDLARVGPEVRRGS